MPLRRTLVPLLVLLALTLVGVAVWGGSGEPSALKTAEVSAQRARESAPRSRARSGAATTSAAGRATTAPPPAGTPPAPPADWLAELQKSLESRDAKPLDAETRARILAAAGKGRSPGGDLHEVLRRATEAFARATTGDERRRAQLTIEWVVGEALRPYREDRALFASVYREVRFGDGALDAPGNSLVRMFRFAEAAARVEALRPQLQTWCYDALAVRAADGFRQDAANWTWFRKESERRRWDVPPDPAWEVAATRLPSELGRTFVAPRSAELGAFAKLVLARVFLAAGEAEFAGELTAAARSIAAEDPSNQWVALRLAEFDPEFAAMSELKALAGFRIPAAAGGTPNLAEWFASHRATPVAHAIGTDGEIELGAWDDEMTRNYLESGLAWAPEEWEAVRRRIATAERAERGGISGHLVKSPQWEVFSDVSAEFSAQATLVLEAAFTQAQAGLGLGVGRVPPIGARIFKHRSDYQAITHDKSGGHWVPGINAVLTFLDDPSHTDFDDFRFPTLVHEATHAALAHYAAKVPSWMHEGLASLVARWNPTWSHAKNDAVTAGWVSRARKLEAARDAGLLPSLDELTGIQSKWDADEFGPVTMARYAAAESLFVHLYADAEHWKTAAAWLDAVRRRRDPSVLPAGAARLTLADEWKDFIDWTCGRLAGER